MIKVEKWIHNFLTESEQKLLFYFLSFFLLGLFLAQIQFAYADKSVKQEVQALKQEIQTDFIQSYDLNKVTYQELISVKGIGPKKAQAILDYQKSDSFKKVEDLMEIKGIGEKTLKSLSPYFYVVINQQKVYADSLYQNNQKSVHSSTKMNILIADIDELMQIKGIGKKKAQAIIQYRSTNQIQSLDDLLNVKGIGPKLLENIKASAFIAGDTRSSTTSHPQISSDIEKININTANITELCTLKGIGTKKAEAIIDYRIKNGSFKSLDDLLNIKGIGKKNLENLKPYIYLGESDEQKQ
ncbi:MAG TPA: helix-hairpin-helix domain-containing protein [Candidatus Cloacimonadota bacterium]|nr:helix-hairpin-helix domain-containing protein [Candidatus Cloacimonadota bacterium]